MHLMTIYLGHEVVIALVTNYGEQLLLLLLEAYKGLLPNKGDWLDEFSTCGFLRCILAY
jgi:hypothetical protein